MDWSLLISIVALALTIYTYLCHDKKLKEQESAINKHQLDKMKLDAEESKKALICGKIAKEGNKYILTVTNNDDAVAHNIKIEGLDSRHILHNATHILPYKLLNPKEEIPIMLERAGLIYIDKLQLVYYWDDDFSNDRKKVQIVPLI